MLAVGSVAAPEGLETLTIAAGPGEIAAEVDQRRTEARPARGPRHMWSSPPSEPALRDAGGGWAARSGDPVLFADRRRRPRSDAEVIERHQGARLRPRPRGRDPRQVVDELRRTAQAGPARAEDPVANAIEFARFSMATSAGTSTTRTRFVIANSDRPLDAGGGRAALGGRQAGTAADHRRRRQCSRRASRASCSTPSPATRTTRPAPSTTTSG